VIIATAPIGINKDAIPTELIQGDQWVVGKYERKDGKLTKVPYRARASEMFKASSTDRETWAPFGVALSVYEVCGYDLILRAITKEDNTTFIDLDHCRNAETGVIAEWAQRWIDYLKSYTEISPSGTGVHIFVHGHPPPEAGHKMPYVDGVIEMYYEGRFATFTGQLLEGTPLTIEERTDELAVLADEVFTRTIVELPHWQVAGSRSPQMTDAEVLRIARGATNSGRFNALWSGDTSGHGGDHSTADAALLSLLAFYTQNEGQLDSLFRQSGLNRDKWERRADYRSRTIKFVLRGLRDVYQPCGNGKTNGNGHHPQMVETIHSSNYRDAVLDETNSQPIQEPRTVLPFVTAAQVAITTPEKQDWIAEGFAVCGGITELDGKIKSSGKTTLLLAQCEAVLNRHDFLGRRTSYTPIVYLTEQSKSSFRVALGRAGLLERDDLVVLFWHDVSTIPWPDVVNGAIMKAKEIGGRYLITDTLGQYSKLTGDSENSAGEALRAMEPLQMATGAHGLAVTVSRHDRKSGGEVGESARGSSAFGGAVDIILSLRRVEGNSPNVRIIESLSRYDETPDKLVIELVNGVYITHGTEEAVASARARTAILEAIPFSEDAALATDELFEAVKEQRVKRTTFNDVLKTLVKEEQVIRVGPGKKNNPHRYWQTPS
jgi:putative DNA primase/helicase